LTREKKKKCNKRENIHPIKLDMCDHTNKGKNIIKEKLEIAVVLSMYIYVRGKEKTYILLITLKCWRTFQPKEIRVKKENRVKKTRAN
jgi:hypothetical protein